jgi:parallel beta-helix repeat protein
MISVVCVAALAVALAACGDDPAGTADNSGGGDGSSAMAAHTLRVPADYRTIQKAVDASKDGDLILISPGVYKEAVTVETEGLTIRGLDRNKVIIDGEFERENGIKVFSNNVAVENLTVRNHTANGVFFTGDYGKGVTLTGYRASYVTAYDNGSYGIYAFNSTRGQFDHDYGSGHPDSGFYIGQCNPCDALITDVTSETNMLGYSGTNSTGVTIVDSLFQKNRAGIVPNSEYGEKLYPNRGTTIVGNRVFDNHNPLAPNSESVAIAWGNGIVLGGVSKAIVERNLVKGNVNAGLVITDYPSTTNPETKKEGTFKPQDNQVRDNTFSGNGFDLAYLTINYASRPFGNCFEDNKVTSSYPDDLQTKMPCTPGNDIDLGDLSGILSKVQPPPPDVDWKKVAAPPAQPQMPNARSAPARGAKGVTGTVDLAKIVTPTA